jgi:hypothetical protein
MIRLTQTRMKIHHASSILPFTINLFKDENTVYQIFTTMVCDGSLLNPGAKGA